MSISLDVTFPHAGSQWVYFNLMVRDAAADRAYDIHQGHEVRVE